jgi:hypothetical protein
MLKGLPGKFFEHDQSQAASFTPLPPNKGSYSS